MFAVRPDGPHLTMLTEEQVAHLADRAIVRCRQYRRSYMADPQLVGDLGQLAGFCAIDRETGEELPVGTAITAANVYYRLGKSVDIMVLMREVNAESFEGLVAAQNTALQQYMWTNDEIRRLVAAGTLRGHGNLRKIHANIRARSLDPKVKVGGSSMERGARILEDLVVAGVEPCNAQVRVATGADDSGGTGPQAAPTTVADTAPPAATAMDTVVGTASASGTSEVARSPARGRGRGQGGSRSSRRNGSHNSRQSRQRGRRRGSAQAGASSTVNAQRTTPALTRQRSLTAAAQVSPPDDAVSSPLASSTARTLSRDGDSPPSQRQRASSASSTAAAPGQRENRVRTRSSRDPTQPPEASPTETQRTAGSQRQRTGSSGSGVCNTGRASRRSGRQAAAAQRSDGRVQHPRPFR